MSFSAGIAPVSHSEPGVCLLDWSVVRVTPSIVGAVGLRPTRWKFNVAKDEVNKVTSGTIFLGPALPNPSDEELARIASLGATLTIKVAFNLGAKQDLVVNLLP